MATTFRFLAAVPILLAAAGALAAPPTDDQVKGAVAAFRAKTAELRKAGTMSEATLKAAANEALAGVHIAEASPAQLSAMGMMLVRSDMLPAARERAAALAQQPTAEGAEASVTVLEFMSGQEPAEAQAAALRTALTHPGLRDALMKGRATGLFMQASAADTEALASVADELFALDTVLTPEMPSMVAGATRFLYTGAMKLGDEHAADRERLRVKAVEMNRAALAAATDEPQKKRHQDSIAFFEGAYARGMLLGHAAPEMAVTWTSDPAITSLAALKGNVVVVDFWATWCGPCVASFPNIRELVKHYEGYPVKVVGVTSLQGAHFGKKGQIDTKDNPAREHELMTEFMAEHEMAWPVAFVEQQVFNPDYGVMGIPHVAIIAPDGTVRFNGLHPASPMDEKTSKINALLKEAGLPSPG